MKQHELKFKPGDRVKLKDTDEPIMMVKDVELVLTEEIKNVLVNTKSAKATQPHEPEYTGKVNVYWMIKGKQNSKRIHQDMLELVSH
jgi:hypothetical protein